MVVSKLLGIIGSLDMKNLDYVAIGLILLTISIIFLVVLLYRNKKQIGNLQDDNAQLRQQLDNTLHKNEHVQAELSGQQVTPETTKVLEASRSAIGSKIEITPQFQKALSLMEHPACCLFITGKAGTGKSTLLRHFVENTSKKVALLAPTGIAALNIHGQTIHSFFHFPPRPIQPQDIKRYPDAELYRKIDLLIIDEVSMVRADLMDGIDLFLKANGRDYQKPFGGIPVVFFGDLYQLPPVLAGKEEEQYFTDQYLSPYFFSAHVFEEASIPIIELTKVYRQNDPTFIEILDAVRHDRVDQAVLSQINHRVQPGFEPGEGWITLSPTNRLVEEINQIKLNALQSPEICFRGVLEGELQAKNLPTSIELKLKENAQVMFVKNDINRRWVNGTLGKIVSLQSNKIQVAIQENGSTYIYDVQQETWESLRYRYDPLKGQLETEVVGAFKQYPLKLAWAVTIHKSQGLTFDQVCINLGTGTFAHGQSYVALSRCRTFNGIVLKCPLRQADIRLDHRIDAFHRQYTRYIL